MAENIIVTTHSHLGNETAITESKTPDGYVPGGVAGYIVGECTILCPGCAREHPDLVSWEDTPEDKNAAKVTVNFRSGKVEMQKVYQYDYIGCMSEWDYPGAYCENCHDALDTNLLVYESQDPEIYQELQD